MIRLSTSQMYNNSMNGVLQSNSRLNTVNNQMSMGKRVLTPADDPVVAAQTLNSKTRMAVVEQYNHNIDFGYKNLDLTESVISQAETALIGLKERAIQLGSDQWTEGQVKASGVEVKEMLNHLQGLLNTRNESGEYIFAGSQADQKAYDGNVFKGDAIEREAQVADDTFIKMLTSGARVFEKLDGLTTHDPELAVFSTDGTENLAEIPKVYSNNMLGIVQYFVDATGNGNPPASVDKEAIRNAIGNFDVTFNQVSQARSQIGARQNTLTAVKESNTDFKVFAEKSISDLENLDFADAYIRLETSTLAYQAGMQVTGKVSGLSLFNYI